jgi:hypothetical protein
MRTQVTPLNIWVWVGSMFVLIQVLIILFFFKAEIIKIGNEHYFDQINYIHEEFKNSTDYKVIIVGSSLLADGVACPEEILNYISSEKRAEIKLLKIWDINDPLKKFIDIDEIIKAKPDLVIFQTELATIKFPNKDSYYDKNVLQNLAHIDESLIKYVFPSLNKAKYNSENRCYRNHLKKPREYDSIHHTPKILEVKSIDDLDIAFEGFSLLQKEGIKTIIADIPRPMQTEKFINTKPFKEQLQELFSMYNENFGIEHWSYTGAPIYYKFSIDGAHLNTEGRSLYTRWLLDKIEREI